MESNTFSTSVFIAAPAKTVYDYLGRLKNLDEWTLGQPDERRGGRRHVDRHSVRLSENRFTTMCAVWKIIASTR